ncbi:D-mandelate dehydrogenase [Atractiella rhizophila]|nr:D-mandelate dehydrogenase [Atractiella rhizophila]
MSKSKVLFLGLPIGIQYAQDLWEAFQQHFDVVFSTEDTRQEFIDALLQKKYGDFHAILKPMVEFGIAPGRWDHELVSLLPETMKIFSAGGAGFDTVDIEEFTKRKIWYSNCPNSGSDAVSDYCLWAILSLFRYITPSLLSCHLQPSSASSFDDSHTLVAKRAINPRGRKLGVIGFGQIGRETANKALLALGMDVWFYDPLFGKGDGVEGWSDRACDSLDELLKKPLDAVCICVNYSSKTHHLCDSEFFSKLHNGCRFINISRGKVVAEEALISALDSGKLGGAALDVHYNEPLINPRLASFDNVCLTSHIGGVTRDSHESFERTSMGNILAVFSPNGRPNNAVNSFSSMSV